MCIHLLKYIPYLATRSSPRAPFKEAFAAAESDRSDLI
jgi:hypothetical protein